MSLYWLIQNDIHDKTLEFIHNINIQLLLQNPTDIWNKQIIKLIKKSIKMIFNVQKTTLLKNSIKRTKLH